MLFRHSCSLRRWCDVKTFRFQLIFYRRYNIQDKKHLQAVLETTCQSLPKTTYGQFLELHVCLYQKPPMGRSRNYMLVSIVNRLQIYTIVIYSHRNYIMVSSANHLQVVIKTTCQCLPRELHGSHLVRMEQAGWVLLQLKIFSPPIIPESSRGDARGSQEPTVSTHGGIELDVCVTHYTYRTQIQERV